MQRPYAEYPRLIKPRESADNQYVINLPPTHLPWGLRLAIWLGAFGWIIGLVAATSPETARIRIPLAGGVVLTYIAACFVEDCANKAPRYLPGTVALAVAAVGTYWIRILAPAIAAQPALVARMARLEAMDGVSPLLVIASAVIGGVLLLVARLWPARPADD